MQEVAAIFQLDIDEQRIGELPFSVVPEPFEVPDILSKSPPPVIPTLILTRFLSQPPHSNYTT